MGAGLDPESEPEPDPELEPEPEPEPDPEPEPEPEEELQPQGLGTPHTLHIEELNPSLPPPTRTRRPSLF